MRSGGSEVEVRGRCADGALHRRGAQGGEGIEITLNNINKSHARFIV